ncbi:MAG: VCBS repeat-containing protein, partial [Caldilineaceae bacterium]|nr:VCBS repeat-containing protein [Caldilineaceae bacterium]
QEGPNYIYLNHNGKLTTRAVWASDDTALTGVEKSSYTLGLAWGDIEGDGDLDLAVANAAWQLSGIYLNLGRVFKTPSGNPTIATELMAQRCITNTRPFCHRKETAPFALVFRPGQTPGAANFSSAEIITATDAVSIPYQLFFSDARSSIRIFPEYSVDGGGKWSAATPGVGGDGVANLTASAWPTGTTHSFIWNAAADVTRSDNVIFRIRTQSAQMRSPIFWPALGSQSPSFRMAAPWYVRVSDWRGQPVAAAELYVDGRFITYTSRAGLVGPNVLPPQTDLSLVALSPQTQIPTPRAAHPNDAAYTIYQTTLADRGSGENRPFVSTPSGEQLLTATISMPLVLYNLVVSIEWPATVTQTHTISEALAAASTYLYDLTDGQMAFRSVTIYDNAQHWGDADIQISAQNTIRPYASIGGITSTLVAHPIRIGRAWNGNDAKDGPWSAADGYRTIAHEFGHYGLWLYDEYFGYKFDSNGTILGRRPGDLFCTNKSNRHRETDDINASAMDWQYSSTELSDRRVAALWGNLCQASAQWQLTEKDFGHGESAWDTLARQFADHQSPARWQILRPSDRGGLLPGPHSLPTALPTWPQITIVPNEVVELVNPATGITVTVERDGTVLPNIGVTLSKRNGTTIEQGQTITAGQLAI